MIFWLVLKLEISYKVIISWKIFGFFLEDFFEDYIFAWWNIWISTNLLFALKILFNENGKATVCDTPIVFSSLKGKKKKKSSNSLENLRVMIRKIRPSYFQVTPIGNDS